MFTFPIWSVRLCRTTPHFFTFCLENGKWMQWCSEKFTNKNGNAAAEAKRVCAIFISFKPACWFFRTRHDGQHKLYILCIFLFTGDHFSFSIVQYLTYFLISQKMIYLAQYSGLHTELSITLLVSLIYTSWFLCQIIDGCFLWFLNDVTFSYFVSAVVVVAWIKFVEGTFGMFFRLN